MEVGREFRASRPGLGEAAAELSEVPPPPRGRKLVKGFGSVPFRLSVWLQVPIRVK